MADKYPKLRIPATLGGCDTCGPSSCRPKNSEVGHPYWDTDLDVLLVRGDANEPPDDWVMVNGHYFDQVLDAVASGRMDPPNRPQDADDYSPLEPTSLDEPTPVLAASDDDDELIDFSSVRGG